MEHRWRRLAMWAGAIAVLGNHAQSVQETTRLAVSRTAQRVGAVRLLRSVRCPFPAIRLSR